MDRRLRLALILSFAIQSVLVGAKLYSQSYDAYVHIFFADHYRQSWWSLWETRWYTGFSVTSYPPLVHQAIALFSHLMGGENAFGLVLLGVLTALPAGVFAFARIFVGLRAAGYAALMAAALPSIYLAAHTFGQLPTLAGLLVALFALATLAHFLRKGGVLSGGQAVVLIAVAAASHHGTLLFLPFAVTAVVLHLLLSKKVDWRQLLPRLAIYSTLAGAAVLIVVWPFWVWGMGEAMQTPIDHLSRHNLILSAEARRLFFWPMYGPLVLAIPTLLWRAWRRREDADSAPFFTSKFWRKKAALAALSGILFLLGLGGTTPLPRWLFGEGWAWLTYDRFSLWASIAVLPLVGQGVLAVQRRRRDRRPGAWPGGTAAASLSFMAISALWAGMLAVIIPTQPAPLDLEPVIEFLAQGDRSRWRYLTFGFGDQLARLSMLTRATTIDGSYHTARSLPEMRSSGIGQIDTAYWSPLGLDALDPILERAGERGVQWGFTNLPAYDRVLRQQGWLHLETLQNGVGVWENPSASLPIEKETPPVDPAASTSWGVFPLVALAGAGWLEWARQRSRAAAVSERETLAGVLRAAHRLGVGLLPVALGFWYYRQIGTVQHDGVYFTYDNILFYVSDGLILASVAAWLLYWWLRPHPFLFKEPRMLTRVLFGLVLLGSASVFWSVDRRISVYTALHLWLVFGLYLSLQDTPESWRTIRLGAVFALLIQAGIASVQFLTQSTAFLAPLQLKWPGDLVPAIRGASVVELLDGTRWLRAYGTLPHPNILVGLIVAFLTGPVVFFLGSGSARGRASLRRLTWATALTGLGLAALVFTFSRAGWLGLATGVLVIGLRRRSLPRRNLLVLAALAILCLVAVALPLRSLIFTRVAGVPVHTEIRSTRERLFLGMQSLTVIRRHPFGVGAGAYVVALAVEQPGSPLFEPVHNVVLLAAGELGLLGGLLCILAGLAALRYIRQATSPDAVVLSAAVAALLVMGLLDHFTWSQAPGRALIWMVLGAWAGQIAARNAVAASDEAGNRTGRLDECETPQPEDQQILPERRGSLPEDVQEERGDPVLRVRLFDAVRSERSLRMQFRAALRTRSFGSRTLRRAQGGAQGER